MALDVNRLRKLREFTVDLGDGLSVTALRPGEAEWADYFTGEADARMLSVELRHVQKSVTGWSGFTEATFLGAEVGSSDAIEFDTALWREAVVDRSAWLSKVADGIVKAIVAHVEKKAASAKN